MKPGLRSLRRYLKDALFLGAFLSTVATGRPAVLVTDYHWTGGSSYNVWTDAANWSEGVAPGGGPGSELTDNVIFGNASQTYTSLTYGEIYVYGLTFSLNTQPYFLQGYATHIGAGGLTYSPSQPVQSAIDTPIQLEASQTWNITTGTLLINGSFSDYYTNSESQYVSHNYTLTKAGAGTLVFGNSYSGDWAGGFTLSQGKVVITPDHSSAITPFGTGTLTFDGGTLVAQPANSKGYDDTPVYLNNYVVSNGLISTNSGVELHIGSSGEGSSSITLNADTTVSNTGRPLFLEGDITESGGTHSLNVNGPGAVVLTGSNSYTGGTNVTNGVLVFGSVYSIPSYNLDQTVGNHLAAGANGYIGFGDSSYTNSVQSYFINDFVKGSTTGTIGLDSDPKGATNTFTGTIDLTGFAPTARLGSATTAIIGATAVITPQGTDYRFGGGGGWLQVDSLLTGARGLVVDSPSAYPLTLWVTNGSNDYSGGTSVTNSALILGSSDTNANLPAGSASGRSITINTGGYVGFRNWGDSSEPYLISSSFAKINLTSVGAVGFENVGSISSAIDLGSFTGALYLGTASWGGEGPGLTLSGPITTTNGGADPYRFAGYKGGALEVHSTLSGSAGVKIGDPNSPGTFGDYFNQQYSSVALTGDNTGLTTGNVTLYGGELLVGQSNGTQATDPTTALGWNTTTNTGTTLVVAGMTLPVGWVDENGKAPLPRLDTAIDGLILNNNISLGTTLEVGLSGNYMELRGQITGTGGLYLEDLAWIAIGHAATDATTPNSFSGGIYLSGNSGLDVMSDHATGNGPVSFGYSSSGELDFYSTAPVVHGLISNQNSDYGYLYAEMPNTVLTIDQSFNSSFSGEFNSEYGSLRVLKTGAGTLRLDNGTLYGNGTSEITFDGSNVSLQVNQGTVVFGTGFSISNSSPIVWVHGGTLTLDNAQFFNPLVVDNGGRLTGSGLLSATTIGTGATLSPGLAGPGQIGNLYFSDHLTLAGGGTYEWNLANPGSFVSDTVTVGSISTLEITATSTNKFTLRAITLGTNGNPGILTGLNPSASYSWMLMSGLSVTGFDPAAFTLDVTQFQTNLGTGNAIGTFSVGLDALTSTQLLLNLSTFAAVPEPSTYALLAVGLGFLGLTAWRKTRRA